MLSEERIRYFYTGKSWFRNMNNVIINYRHKGEANDLYLIHMNHRCELDRVACCPSVWRWR